MPDRYLVFFDWNKATLTAEARRVIGEAAQAYKTSGKATIVATGHTDTSGSAAYNMRLSVRRAEAVKAELVRLACRPPASPPSAAARQSASADQGRRARAAESPGGNPAPEDRKLILRRLYGPGCGGAASSGAPSCWGASARYQPRPRRDCHLEVTVRCFIRERRPYILVVVPLSRSSQQVIPRPEKRACPRR